jgi:amino acid transporter
LLCAFCVVAFAVAEQTVTPSKPQQRPTNQLGWLCGFVWIVGCWLGCVVACLPVEFGWLVVLVWWLVALLVVWLIGWMGGCFFAWLLVGCFSMRSHQSSETF